MHPHKYIHTAVAAHGGFYSWYSIPSVLFEYVLFCCHNTLMIYHICIKIEINVYHIRALSFKREAQINNSLSKREMNDLNLLFFSPLILSNGIALFEWSLITLGLNKPDLIPDQMVVSIFIMAQIVEMHNYHIYYSVCWNFLFIKNISFYKKIGDEGIGGVIWGFKLNEIAFLNIDKIIHFRLEPFMFKKLVSWKMNRATLK